jgi:hypothetical protein
MVSTLARAIGIAVAFTLGGCAAVSSQPVDQAITVARTPSFGVCLGVCPHYTVSLSPTGQVVAENHTKKSIARFRVSMADAEHFREMLRPLKPLGGAQAEPICTHNVSPDEAGLVRKAREVEIVWSGPSPSRLIACDSPELSETLRQALWSLHLYLDGNPRPGAP